MKTMYHWFFAIFCLGLGLTACTTSQVMNTPQPTATPAELALLPTFTPTLTPSPVFTPTPSVTPDRVATALARPTKTTTPILPTRTPQPTRTPTATFTPTITPTPTATFVWHEQVSFVTSFASTNLAWSPTQNQLVYGYTGPEVEDALSPFYVALAQAPDFAPQDVTPAELIYYYNDNYLWHPSGEFFLLAAVPKNDTSSTHNGLWQISQKGEILLAEPDNITGSFVGWLNNTQFSDSLWQGGGHIGVTIQSLEDGLYGSTVVHGSSRAITSQFVVIEDSLGLGWSTVGKLTTDKTTSPEFEGDLRGSSVKFLGYGIGENGYHYDFFSSYKDTRPDTQQILVSTWTNPAEFEYEKVFSGEIPVDLQMWDLETEQLTMFIPGGITGRFSPDGRWLAYVTPDPVTPQLHLLDLATQNIVFSTGYTTFSFSPNSRYLTFYTLASPSELAIYDIETQMVVYQAPADEENQVSWSPDNTHLVYWSLQKEVMVYDTRLNSAYPLIIPPSPALAEKVSSSVQNEPLATPALPQLSKPQWSFDGQYLSLEICTCGYTEFTIILKFS